MPPTATETYVSLLGQYCKSRDTSLLGEAAVLGETFIEIGMTPMDIKAVHDRAIGEFAVDGDQAGPLISAHRFLLEVLVAYGLAYSAISERLLADADAASAREMRMADDAARAEQSRLALLAGVSHELGNPLMVVKVNVSSIRKFLEERDSWPEDLSQRESDAMFAIERMLTLREELLAASKNEQRELESVPLHLVHILQLVVRWGRTNAANKGILLTEEYEHLDCYVLGDEAAVQSIFTNLLSNAIRYTLSGGAITVRARRDDACVVVEVEDTGIGISEEDQPRIYERFFRTESGQKATVFGIGLGLSLTRDLVTALAGTISVESTPDVGSTFTVRLPVAEFADAE